MTALNKTTASPLMVTVAFATVYLVWGSTYFFISVAVLGGMPPLVLGTIRFLVAGLLMLTWCIAKGDKVWNLKNIGHSAVSGLMLLLIGNGVVMWVEKSMASAVVAIMVSAAPIWTVLLDKRNWRENLSSSFTIIGLIVGFAGMLLLFGEQFLDAMHASKNAANTIGVVLLIIGSICWTGGSLYSKYNSGNIPARVNIAWQMLAAGIAFIPVSLASGEWHGLDLMAIPAKAWFALSYLVVFGSIAAFSAYVWLMGVRPATQVSTYGYVNPVIAVVLGIVFASEHVSLIQIGGLVVILGSVLLINLAKYRKAKPTPEAEKQPEPNGLKVACD